MKLSGNIQSDEKYFQDSIVMVFLIYLKLMEFTLNLKHGFVNLGEYQLDIYKNT